MNQQLEELQDVIKGAIIQRAGGVLSNSICEYLARSITDIVQEHYSGERIRMPIRHIGLRNLQVMADWRAGKSIDSIASGMNISVSTVYQIISAHRRRL